MLNQAVVVGRIDYKDNNFITLAVPQSFKNKDGIYDTDYIDVEVSGNFVEAMTHIKRGDLVGVKGRLKSGGRVIAEKITFLSSKDTPEEQEEHEE